MATVKSMSEMLGRNLFVHSSSISIGINVLQKYILGALMSGSLLYIDEIDKTTLGDVSQLSRDLYKLLSEFIQKSINNPQLGLARRSSSPCRLFKEEKDQIFDIEKNLTPESERFNRSKTESEIIQSLYYELQNSKLNKGTNWSRDNFIPESNHPYNPNYVIQTSIFSRLIDVRYGFGLYVGITDSEDLRPVPVTLRSQMRTHFMIAVDQRFVVKPYLIMAGQDGNCIELEDLIHDLIENIDRFQPHILGPVKKLIPKTIAKADWVNNDSIIALKKSIISTIVPTISNDLQDQDIFKIIVENTFPADEISGDDEINKGMVHEIKCQIRLRDRDVLAADIDKIMELQTCIATHQITIVAGPHYCGKTSAVDILACATNNLVRPSRSAQDESKNRGTIDILKSMSNERKLQTRLGNLYENHGNKRIFQQRITLSNFGSDELVKPRFINGIEKPSLLSSILDPLLQSKCSGKFQIWLCVETTIDNLDSHLSILRSYVDKSVKIIIELEDARKDMPCDMLSFSDGIVHFYQVDNMMKSTIEVRLKSMLNRKIITYYGSQYLLGAVVDIFDNLFKSIQVEIEASQDTSSLLHCLIQSIDILEIIFLANKEASDDTQDSLNDVHRRINTCLCFAIIQGARGLIYSTLIDKRMMSHEQFESILRNVLSQFYDFNSEKNEESQIDLFGLMIDFHSMDLKPFHKVKGCKLPEFWSCDDGVARYVMQLLIRYDKSIFLTGPWGRLEPLLQSTRYNKRLGITDDLIMPILRRTLHEKHDDYWQIGSNTDPLITRTPLNEIILLQDFLTDSHMSTSVRSLLQFSLEHKFIFDINSDDISYQCVSLRDFVLIVTKYNDCHSFGPHQFKWTRWFTIINVIDPNLADSRMILYRAVYPWIRQVPKQSTELSKLFAMRIAHFIADVGVSVRKETRNRIITNISQINNHEFPQPPNSQLSWDQMIQMTRSIISLPLDLFIGIFLRFEKKFAEESQFDGKYSIEGVNSETMQNYKRARVKIRIIRYIIYVISRFIIDPLKNRDDRENAIAIIGQHLENNFFNLPAFEIDEMLLKHFPLSVDPITEIIMLPSRICDEDNDTCAAHYQPCVEAHSWKILQIAKGSIFRIQSIEDHLSKSLHLKCIMNSDDFVKNLMKMYKHISAYDMTKSALFVEYSSSLVHGLDWGCFLSGLVQAKHLVLETSSYRSGIDFQNSLKLAMNLAGIDHLKVIFHLDSSLVFFNQEIGETIIRMLEQNSIAHLLQLLQLPYVHKTVKEGHQNMSIQSGSIKELTLSRIFLENVKKNLKIVITVNKHDIEVNGNIKMISDFFHKRFHRYLVIDEDDIKWYKESLAGMVPMLMRSQSDQYKIIADAHTYFDNIFRKFINVFGSAFRINGHHLQLSMNLYSFLFQCLTDKIQLEISSFERAVQSVNNAQSELDNLKANKIYLQNSLISVNEEIHLSSIQLKNMKDNYTIASTQCRNQEKLVRELTEPLESLTEKSKSNLSNASPTYMAALDAIRNLDLGAIEEIMTYIKPPQQVRHLLEIIFRLLGYEANWNEIKELMVKINLYEELLYFDKDHIDDSKYRYLMQALTDDDLQQDNLKNISQAAASLSGWLHAVFKYSSLNRDINPQLGQLLTLQDKLNRTQSELGKMKVRLNDMRQDLEAKLLEHKDLAAKKKNISDRIRDLTYKIGSGEHLLSDLKTHSDYWNKQVDCLNQELKDIPLETVTFIIKNVYLSRFPTSLRLKILADFLNQCHLDAKIRSSCQIFNERQLKGIIDGRVWNSCLKRHIDNVVQMATVICCPQISFPGLGSMIFIHCDDHGWTESSDVFRKVLEFMVESNFHSNLHNESTEIVKYVDCSITSVNLFDIILKDAMKTGSILFVEKLELLGELPESLHQLLYGKETELNTEINSAFRLILLTTELYSSSDPFHGLLTSTRILNYDFSFGAGDVRDYVCMSLFEICQPVSFTNLLESINQTFEINESYKDKQNELRSAVARCSVENNPRDLLVDNESTTRSLLDVHNFHSLILETDSELLAVSESLDSMGKQCKFLREFTRKYESVTDNVCQLLNEFCQFELNTLFDMSLELDSIIIKRSMSLRDVIAVIKIQAITEMKCMTMKENVDAEISEEFLKKLQNSLITSLVVNFDDRMDCDELMECVVKFCISNIVEEQRELECLIEDEEVKFIKDILLCKDVSKILNEAPANSLAFIHNQINDDISQEVLHISLLVETNISSLVGLSKSMVESKELWREYFQLPFISSTRMPGFAIVDQPELLQKAVVWRALNPMKTNEIFSALISHVFGEDIFKFMIDRNEKLEQLLVKSLPWKPIILSNRTGVLNCSQNPLELIENCLQRMDTSSRMILMDCTSQSSISDLFVKPHDSGQGEQKMCLDQWVKQPNWLVLLNAHIYDCPGQSRQEFDLHKFVTGVWKPLLKYFHKQSSSMKIHSEFKIFIILEISESTRYSDILLDNATLFHCRPAIDFHRRCHDNTLLNNESNDVSKILAIIHGGIFASNLFKWNSACTNQDYKCATNLSSFVCSSPSDLVCIVKLIFECKFLNNEMKMMFTDIVTSLSPLFNDFANKSVSEIGLLRTAEIILQNVVLTPSNSDNKIFHRTLNSDDILFDQRSADLVKSRFLDIHRRLKKTISNLGSGYGNIEIISFRKIITQILNKLLDFPIWSIRYLSSTRFDSRISSSDITSLRDQYFLCNDRLPLVWTSHNHDVSLSEWLDNVDDLVDRIGKFTTEFDDDILTKILEEFKKILIAK